MRKAFYAIVLSLAAIGLHAAERTEAEIRAIAYAKLNQTSYVKGLNGTSQQPLTIQRLVDEKAYCIYAPSEGKGFVIVAKSDLTDPIIGYSDSRFDVNNMPDGLKWYLTEMSHELAEAEQGRSHRAPRRAAATFTPVENFVTTTWSQDYPFDRKTPNNYPAGCVATALAQCMNYCQWPASASFDAVYYVAVKKGTKITNERKTATVNSTYNWPYKDNYKSVGRYGDNIDELLRDCGYATYMGYAANGSGTQSYVAGTALTTCFSYPQESVKYIMYDYFNDPDRWAQIIYDELAHRSPVYYAAADSTQGGHAFIFSGVDDNGLVYVNWGWRGNADGYYAINNLRPNGNGHDENFSYGFDMIYGIRPEPLPTDHIETRIYGYTGNPYTFRFDKTTDDEGVEHNTLYCDLPYGFINMCPSDFVGVFGLFGRDLTDGTDWEIAPDLQDRDTIPAGYGYASSSDDYKDFAFYYYIDGDKGLKPGHKYHLSFGTKDDREGSWHSILCIGGELGYELTYTGDIATSTIVPEKKPAPVLTAIHDIKTSNVTPADDGITRVFDTAGRLIYTAPTQKFNLWDVNAHGILVIKQGNQVRKVVR